MRTIYFAWPDWVMPRVFVLSFLLTGVSWGCGGQVPIDQKSTTHPTSVTKIDSIIKPVQRSAYDIYKKKSRIEYLDSKKRLESITADGQVLDFDWDKVIDFSKEKSILKEGAKITSDMPHWFHYKYKMTKGEASIKEKLARVGFDIPIEKVRKSASMHYQSGYINSGAFLCIQTTVYLYDSSQTYVVDQYGYGNPHYRVNKIKVYNYKGEQIAQIENKSLPLSTSYLFWGSDDDRYILIGSVSQIGEVTDKYDDFLLYDTKLKKTTTISHINGEKYDGIDCCLVEYYYDEGVFKLIYSNGIGYLEFFIDPYQRKTYTKYISRPNWEELRLPNLVFRSPSLPDKSDKDELSKYIITPF